jgi:tRNA (guanine6-N2)-methyltransferase
MVIPGLESIAADEIRTRLNGEVTRTAPGLVVFRPATIDRSLLSLRTTEDVFLLAWGTDQLTHRAEDLKRILQWTDREARWDRLLQVHHGIRPKPKGKPTFHLVVQMTGEHGYRRLDARKALARGLAGKLPASWRHADENAAVEIWLTIHGAQAVCGVRLSDRTMRHRRYKFAHLPASLRPTLAAAMVRLAEVRPGQTLLDPMCGAGTILAEALVSVRGDKSEATAASGRLQLAGGDVEHAAVRAASANLSRLGPVLLARWDARRLPLPDAVADRIVCNLPFGVKLVEPQDIPPLYQAVAPELDRVLKRQGMAVLLVADVPALKQALDGLAWKPLRQVRVRVLGQAAMILVYRKL